MHVVESGAKWSTERKRKRWKPNKSKRGREGFSPRSWGWCSCAPRQVLKCSKKKLQGTMNVGAMTHKPINAVYKASPTRKSIARAGGPHFESLFPLYGAKLLSNARSMPGGWVTLELTGTTLVRARFDLTVAKLTPFGLQTSAWQTMPL